MGYNPASGVWNGGTTIPTFHELLFDFAVPVVNLWRFGRRVGPLVERLAERERWEPERLRAWQLERVRDILVHCDRRVPFYRRRFRECGFNPERLDDLSQIEALPLLTKQDIREHDDDLFASGVSRRLVKKGRTGGSTGEPTPFFLSREEAAWFEATVRRCWDWIGVRPGARLVKVAGRTYTSDWRRPVISFVMTRLRNTVSLPAPYLDDALIDRYIETLERRRAEVLYGYPSSMELLSRRLIETGRRLPSVRAVWTSSETLLDPQREVIRQAFGLEPFDGYGGGDGPIAMECRRHHGLHVFQNARLVEVVDEQGHAVPPGGTGRVVVTQFFNRAWPFVRYDTGDLAEVLGDEPCPCGVRLPRLARVHGRTGDILVTPDQRRVTVANVTLVFGPIHDQVRAYQLFQERPDEIQVRIVRTPAFSNETERYIERSLRTFLGPVVRLDFRYLDDIPPTPAGKRRIVVSALSPDTGPSAVPPPTP